MALRLAAILISLALFGPGYRANGDASANAGLASCPVTQPACCRMGMHAPGGCCHAVQTCQCGSIPAGPDRAPEPRVPPRAGPDASMTFSPVALVFRDHEPSLTPRPAPGRIVATGGPRLLALVCSWQT